MTKDEFKATAAENAASTREMSERLHAEKMAKLKNGEKPSLVNSIFEAFFSGLSRQMDRASRIKWGVIVSSLERFLSILEIYASLSFLSRGSYGTAAEKVYHNVPDTERLYRKIDFYQRKFRLRGEEQIQDGKPHEENHRLRKGSWVKASGGGLQQP